MQSRWERIPIRSPCRRLCNSDAASASGTRVRASVVQQGLPGRHLRSLLTHAHCPAGTDPVTCAACLQPQHAVPVMLSAELDDLPWGSMMLNADHYEEPVSIDDVREHDLVLGGEGPQHTLAVLYCLVCLRGRVGRYAILRHTSGIESPGLHVL